MRTKKRYLHDGKGQVGVSMSSTDKINLDKLRRHWNGCSRSGAIRKALRMALEAEGIELTERPAVRIYEVPDGRWLPEGHPDLDMDEVRRLWAAGLVKDEGTL